MKPLPMSRLSYLAIHTVFFLLSFSFACQIDTANCGSVSDLDDMSPEISSGPEANPIFDNADSNKTGVEFLPENRVVNQGRVYKQPSLTSRIIGFTQDGQKVTTLLKEKDWYVIRLSDNAVGWVQKDIFERKDNFKEPKADSKPPIPIDTQKADSEKELLVVVAAAGIRKEPGPKNDLFFPVRDAEKLTLLESLDSWLMVKLESGQTGWIHRNHVAPAPEAESARKSGPATIEAIGGDVSEDRQESVKILLDRFSPPETFVLEGENPRIVCDFFAAVPHPDIEPEMVLKGDFISKIRIGAYAEPEKKVRVVLDLVPSKNYEVQQIFFEKENLYVLSVGKKES